MKKIISVVAIIMAVALLFGCAKSTQNETSTTKAETTSETKTATENSTAKTAVIYFSETGNTEKIAKSISNTLGVEIFKITPKDEYTAEDIDYNNDDCRANKEMSDESARPEIINNFSDLDSFDTIYLGYPIWWGTAPRVIDTFLDTYDLSTKTVYTFCTSGSSGIEKSVSDLEKNHKNLKIKASNRFENSATDETIKTWTDELK